MIETVENRRPTVALSSRRAATTRLALLNAARVVIARDGYVNARIADISSEAGKSVGVFYSYFKDKTELFAALVDAFVEDLESLGPDADAFEVDTVGAVRASVSVFWVTYRQFHPEMLGLMETGMTDPNMLKVWRKIRDTGIRRFAYRIREQQKKGRCVALEPQLAASALQGLLEFTCFNWRSMKLDYPDALVEDERAVETLYQIIARVFELDLDAMETPSVLAKKRSARK